MKVYIAGKITGCTGYRQQFMAAEWRLSEMGFSVMNPAWLYAYPAFERDDYLAVSRAMLERCDAVFLLPNWGGSAGVKAELRIAERRGMRVFEADTGEAGCWRELGEIAAKERQEREARLGPELADWLRDKAQERLREINAPGCRKQRQAELAAAAEAFMLVYDEIERRKKE